MHHSCLCDSAKDIPSKPLPQIVGKNVFGQSVCRVFLIFDILKSRLVTLISSQCYFEIKIHSIDFLCKFIGCTLYEYDIVFKFLNELFSEYFSLSSFVVPILSWCFNEVTRIKMCIEWLIALFYWHSRYWHWR